MKSYYILILNHDKFIQAHLSHGHLEKEGLVSKWLIFLSC